MDLCTGVARNCRKTETQTQERVLNCGKKTKRLKHVCVTVQGVSENCSKQFNSNLKWPGWTTVFHNPSHKLGRSENDLVFGLKTNVLIW